LVKPTHLEGGPTLVGSKTPWNYLWCITWALVRVGSLACWLSGVLALESFQVGSGLLNTI